MNLMLVLRDPILYPFLIDFPDKYSHAATKIHIHILQIRYIWQYKI